MSEQVIFGGLGQNYGSNTETRYMTPFGGPNHPYWPDTEEKSQVVIASAGNISDLRIVLDDAPGAGNSVTFTMNKNGVATDLSFTISDTDTSGSDSDVVAVSAGDLLCLEVVPSSSPSYSSVRWTFKFDGSTAKESLLSGATYAPSQSVSSYFPVFGFEENAAEVEFDVQMVFPTSGTVKNLYVSVEDAPGDGNSMTYLVRDSGGDSSPAVTCTISNLETSANDTSHSFTVSAGDTICIQTTPSGTPKTTTRFRVGLTFLADTDGQFIIPASMNNWLNATNTEFNYICGAGSMVWTTTEADRYQLGQTCTIKNIYVVLQKAPSTNDSFVFTLRKDGGDASPELSVTISDSATTGNASADVSIANDDLLDTEVVPVSSPDLDVSYMSYMGFIEPSSALTDSTNLVCRIDVIAAATSNLVSRVEVYVNDYTPHKDCRASWLFKEGSGGTVADSSQNSFTGTFKTVGEPLWSDDVPRGYTNSSVDFDGVDDYIECGDVTDLTGDFTIILVFKPDSWDTSAGEYNGLISKRDTYAGMAWQIFYQNPVDGTEGLTFWWGNEGAEKWETGLKPSTGAWHALILRRTGNDFEMRLDKSKVAITNNAGAIPSNTEKVYLGWLGADGSGGASDHFDGHIALATVFDEHLSDEACARIIRRGMEGDYTWYFSPYHVYTGSVLHPDVIRLPTAQDGFRYWMVNTPYPPAANELPRIYRSVDACAWTEVGITNPVVDTSYEHNDDPDILYVDAYKKWFMAFAAEDDSEPYKKFLGLAYSTDGKTWTEYDGTVINSNTNPIILSGEDDNGESWEQGARGSSVIYPSLIYEDGIFTLFYGEITGAAADENDGGHDNNVGQLGYATFTWNNTTNDIENFARSGNNPVFAPAKDGSYWYGAGHFDITYDGAGTYYMLCLRRLQSGDKAQMWEYTCTDKESWANGSVVETIGSSGEWNDNEIYRGCYIHNGEGLIVELNGKKKRVFSSFGLAADDANIGLADPATFWDEITEKNLVSSVTALIEGTSNF